MSASPLVSLPPYRFLRGYSLDPGFSTRLDTVGINEVVYRVPFEPLEPGPIGEYIEVMDFDPSSGAWYEPVDLGDERIASQHGLTPSEGNPQFHQQFVYAVAMKTIRHFEHALGRRIVWYPRVLPPGSKAGRTKDARWRRPTIPTDCSPFCGRSSCSGVRPIEDWPTRSQASGSTSNPRCRTSKRTFSAYSVTCCGPDRMRARCGGTSMCGT